MAEKKLSDEEILKMIEDFEALTPEERASRIIGDVRSKTAYQIPNSDYILKEATPISEKLRGRGLDNEMLIRQYIASKQANKINDLVSQPILVNRPKKDAYLIQKKLEKITPTVEQELSDYQDKLKRASFDWSDLAGTGNIGVDSDGKIRGFDIDEGVGIRGDKAKTEAFKKTRKTAIEKISKSKVPNIYRSIPLIGPVIGAGLAAMSGDANAASAMPILGEADSLGPEKGMEDYEIENPQANPAARRAALEKLMRK
jgi:hypothetical protein